MIDRAGLAAFLRSRREALRPEDVGLPRGSRRRTPGLRREEVSVLCHISTDYYSRLERERGPQPSEQMIASLAQGLRLSIAERNHLFELAGHRPPVVGGSGDHISPGLLRILDRLSDTPAEVVTELGESLRQTPVGIALTGELTGYRGLERSIYFRWFTGGADRDLHPVEEQPELSRFFVSELRAVVVRRGPSSKAAAIVAALTSSSAEFRELWDLQEVGRRMETTKRFLNAEVGLLELNCHALNDPEQSHSLLFYTATPGSSSAEKLELLGVIGAQSLA